MRRIDAWLMLAAAAACIGGGPASAQGVSGGTGVETVATDSGQVRGASGRDPAIAVYRGIPFAAPPVGPLRFRPPQPPATWQGVRDAGSFGAICPQHGGAAERFPMDEDCLTLNIWSAQDGGGERPVLVWIYGGGFAEGHGSDPTFDGEALAAKGVVVVTFNYRLGPFGFLATPELSAEAESGRSGNYGILDQIAALQWVQRNIAGFGGDPAKVTIAGQSAGAGSVQFLAMSPLAEGLFRAGIAQSQVRDPRDPELRYLATSWRPRPAAEAAGAAFADGKGARSPDQLRTLPWRDLLQGSERAADDTVDTGSTAKPPLFRPVVDGVIIPGGFAEALAKKAYAPITFVAGNNLDESGAVPETSFAARRADPPVPRAGLPPTNVTVDGYQSWATAKFGTLAGEFLRLYPAADDEQAARASNEAMRDNARISTWLWGKAWSRQIGAPLYTYYWTHARPGPTRDMRGAFHGSELNYVFDSLDAVENDWTAEDHRIADIVSTYWANIATHGNPNGAGLPGWPGFAADRPLVMELGEAFAPISIAAPERIAFWERYFATQDAW